MNKKRFENQDLNQKKGQTKKTYLKIVNSFLLSLFFFCGGFYLFNINQITVQGFELQEKKNNLDYLAEKNRSLEDEVNASQSYYVFNDRINDLNMVEAKDVIYLTRNDQVLAKK